MRRYDGYAQSIPSADGTKRYSTIYYEVPPRQESDIYITATVADRLDLLAHKYYNNVGLWFIIAKANNIPPGSFRVKPGTILRIPYPVSSNDLSEFIINI